MVHGLLQRARSVELALNQRRFDVVTLCTVCPVGALLSIGNGGSAVWHFITIAHYFTFEIFFLDCVWIVDVITIIIIIVMIMIIIVIIITIRAVRDNTYMYMNEFVIEIDKYFTVVQTV